jgi:hypothetical protein
VAGIDENHSASGQQIQVVELILGGAMVVSRGSSLKNISTRTTDGTYLIYLSLYVMPLPAKPTSTSPQYQLNWTLADFATRKSPTL